MTDKTECEEVEASAAELALGTLSGDERARMLNHIARCPGCRELVVELSTVGDELLTLAPSKEPSVGFESRVIPRLSLSRRGWRRWIAAVAAAAVLAGVVSAGAVLWTTSEDRDLAARYKEQLARADGRYFGTRDLRAGDTEKAGNVFVYAGSPSWIFVSFEEAAPGSYIAELEMETGETLQLGEFEVGEKRTWGTALPVELTEAAEFRVMRGGVAQFTSSLGEDH